MCQVLNLCLGPEQVAKLLSVSSLQCDFASWSPRPVIGRCKMRGKVAPTHRPKLGCSVHRVLSLLGHVLIGPRTALGVPTHCEQTSLASG